MTKGEYLDSIGLKTYLSPKILQEELDDEFKQVADRMAEVFFDIYNDEYDDDDYCYECGGYGDDYTITEDGKWQSNCDDCPHNPSLREDDWEGN